MPAFAELSAMQALFRHTSLFKQWDNERMNAPLPPVPPSQPVSPRKRLQELLAIPDSQRTDAQWDELNEIEIKLAPGNREPGNRDDHGDSGPPRGGGGGHASQGQGRGGPPGNQQPSGRGPMGKRPARKFHKRPPKPNTPQG